MRYQYILVFSLTVAESRQIQGIRISGTFFFFFKQLCKISAKDSRDWINSYSFYSGHLLGPKEYLTVRKCKVQRKMPRTAGVEG